MAVLYITELRDIGGGGNFPANIAHAPSLAKQTVAIGGSSVASTAFGPNTTMIRVHTDAICSIDIRTAPVATATTERMAANQTEYWAINPGDKIAVITNT